MPSSNDIDENVCTDDQLMLIDLLYGELDGDLAQGARDTIDADSSLRAELDEFEQLRGFMRELPDEEPAAALTAKLLHAAAQAAPAETRAVVAADVAAAGGGGFFAWLKRFFEPMMMHPGLAAAASLVLVAGIAGALYLGGKSQMAEPTAARHADVKSEMAPAGAAPDKPPLADPAPAQATATPTMDDDIPSRDQERVGVTAGTAGSGGMDRGTKGRGNTAGGLLGDDKTAAKRIDTTVAKPKPKLKNQRPPRTRSSAGGKAEPGSWELTEGDSSGKTAPGAATPRPRAKPAPARPTPQPPSVPEAPRPSTGDSARRPQAPKKAPAKKPTTVRGTSGSTISAEPAPPPAPKPADEAKPQKKVSEASRLHQQARAAAKKGDCARVVAIARQVRKSDSRYYDTKFLGDSSLRSCLRAKSKSNVSK